MSVADPATLRALAQRAREASGPDRALDADVAHALGWEVHRRMRLHTGDPLTPEYGRNPDGQIGKIPAFSGSLDSVIRDVVPVDWRWLVDTLPDYKAHADVECLPLGHAAGSAATLALALLAAALETRATVAESNQ